MKVATAAYPLDFMTSWAQYEEKISAWVDEAVKESADLLVFPEYAGLELATLAGRDVTADLEKSLFAVSERLPEADALHAKLAKTHDVHILAGSGFAATGARPVNRSRLFAPRGDMAAPDKQIMTRYEREVLDLQGGDPLQIYDTALGKLGVLICYDAEFPLLGRALSECQIILVPSCTEALSGYWRVRIGAMARALENQCVTVMASIVGSAEWSAAVEISVGAGGVFGPPDIGFPPTGVLAAGNLNVPGWTYAEFETTAVDRVRRDGTVLGREHWREQQGRDGIPDIINLR